MENINGKIRFSKTERRDAQLPAEINRSEAHDALVVVDGWKADCVTRLQELSVADVHDIHPLHLANGITKHIRRFHRLEVLSKDLGSLVAEDLDVFAATGIIDESLAGIPGLELGHLHEE